MKARIWTPVPGLEVDTCYVRGDGDITAGLTPLTLTPTRLSQERLAPTKDQRAPLLSAHLLAADTLLITAEPNNSNNSTGQTQGRNSQQHRPHANNNPQSHGGSGELTSLNVP